MDHSFKSWLDRRRRGPPEADKIVPLVSAAGAMGMSRQQIGNAVDLDRDTLDALLGAMVSAAMVILSWEAGGPVYRASAV